MSAPMEIINSFLKIATCPNLWAYGICKRIIKILKMYAEEYWSTC